MLLFVINNWRKEAETWNRAASPDAAALVPTRSSGEALGGRYFWVKDLVIVETANIATIVATVENLAAAGELHAMERVAADDEAPEAEVE